MSLDAPQPEGSTPEDRLASLGLDLPEPASPLASYVAAVREGDLVLTAGQLPLRQGELSATGKVGADVPPDVAAQCAQQATLNALAAVRAEVGDLSRIRQVVRVVVYVASAPDFTAHPAVANGASDLLGQVFGDAGRHVRSAVGVAVLPLDAPVEVELTVAL